MRNLIIYLKIIFLGLFVSCVNQEKGERSQEEKVFLDSIFNQSMVIHDEVMPKIDAIMNYKLYFKDVLAETDSLNLEMSDSMEVVSIIKDLDVADEMMMSWMRNFTSKPADTLDFKIAREFLTEGYVEINKVKDSMNQSLERASNIKKNLTIQP